MSSLVVSAADNRKVVCLGETMAMVVPTPLRRLADAVTLQLSHGGAESNVAVWLAKLGCDVAWCSRLGADPFGRRILAELAAVGVDTHLVVVESGARTGVYFKDPGPESTGVHYYRDKSAASRIDESDVDRALDTRPYILHISGITSALSRSCSRAIWHAIARAPEHGSRVSFDVNYRPALWPSRQRAAEELKRVADECDIVFVGLDEAHKLWGAETVAEVQDVLPAPPILVVKDGARYATSRDTGALVRVAALPVPVLEPVGAGDGFAAGWLRGELLGMTPAERLRLGHLVAACALASATDQAPLPSWPGTLESMARSGMPWR